MKFFLHLRRIKPLDWVLFVLSLGIAAASMSVYVAQEGTPVLVIESGGSSWVYETGRDEVLHVEGAEGITTIKIENGSVSFTDSPCVNKTCVASHAISLTNEWIACLPNMVFARIEGTSDDSTVDILSN